MLLKFNSYIPFLLPHFNCFFIASYAVILLTSPIFAAFTLAFQILDVIYCTIHIFLWCSATAPLGNFIYHLIPFTVYIIYIFHIYSYTVYSLGFYFHLYFFILLCSFIIISNLSFLIHLLFLLSFNPLVIVCCPFWRSGHQTNLALFYFICFAAPVLKAFPGLALIFQGTGICSQPRLISPALLFFRRFFVVSKLHLSIYKYIPLLLLRLCPHQSFL